MKYVLIGLMSLVSSLSMADTFNKKHYQVVKSIIWAADKVEVPRSILLALCWGESSFRRDSKVTHIDGDSLSHGVCQMKLETALWMDDIYGHKIAATAKRLENPSINAFYAAKYLKYLLKHFDNDWQLAIDGYNKGPGNAIGENTAYLKKFNKSLKLIIQKLPEVADNETLQAK